MVSGDYCVEKENARNYTRDIPCRVSFCRVSGSFQLGCDREAQFAESLPILKKSHETSRQNLRDRVRAPRFLVCYS